MRAPGSLLPKFMPAIDGLRAFAVLAVLTRHFPYPAGRYALFNDLHLAPLAQTGWIGVDLFFVISGFLITGILLDAKDSPHYFRNFYARRALRIWPLYYAVLTFVLVIYPLIHPSGTMVHEAAPWMYYVLYIQNFSSASTRLLGVTWSLAVEEQFYITWPFVVLVLDKKTLRKLAIVLLAASPIIRFLFSRYVGEGFTFMTFCRMDGILAGSLLALWFRSESASIPRLRKMATRLLVVGGIGSVVFLMAGTAEQPSIFTYSFLAMGFSGLLCFAAVDSLLPRPFHALLTNSWLRYVGKISYAIYLLHAIVYQMFDFTVHKLRIPLERDTFGRDAIAFVAQVGLVILAASVSWYFFEQPILKLKKRFEMRAEPEKSKVVMQLANEENTGT